MNMVRFTLSDGTKKEMTVDESNSLSLEGMEKEFGGKTIKNIEFFEEDAR